LIVGLIAGAVAWLISFEQRTGKVSQALRKAGEWVIDLANSFIDLYNSSMPIRIAVNYIVASFKTGFAAAKLALMQFLEPMKLAGKLIKAALTFDVQGIKDAFTDFAKNSKNNVEKAATSVADSWSTAYNNAMKGKLNHISKANIITVKTNGIIDEESSGGPSSGKVKPGATGSGGGGVDDEENPDDSDAGSGKKKKGKKVDQDKELKEKQEKELKALEEVYQQRQGIIEEQHIKEQDSEASFMIKKAVAEREYLEDKKFMLERFGMATEEVDDKLRERDLEMLKDRESILKDQEGIMNDFNEKLLEDFSEKLRKEEEAEAEKNDKKINDTLEYGEFVLEQTARTEDEKLALLKRKYDEGKISTVEFEKETTRIHAEAEDERQKKTERRFAVTQELTSSAINLVNSMMELELQKAGDNEEKKNEIRKKYAGIQFAATVAQIVVDTAGAVMKAYQQLGPIGGTIAAALLTATGIVQIQIAKAQKNQVINGSATGGYTGDGDTYEPAGIVHHGEWVAPRSMVKDNRFGGVISWLESNRRAGNFTRVSVPSMSPAVSRGYASGGYVSGAAIPAPEAQADRSATDQALVNAINKLMDWKPKVYSEVIKRDFDVLDEINKNRKM